MSSVPMRTEAVGFVRREAETPRDLSAMGDGPIDEPLSTRQNSAASRLQLAGRSPRWNCFSSNDLTSCLALVDNHALQSASEDSTPLGMIAAAGVRAYNPGHQIMGQPTSG